MAKSVPVVLESQNVSVYLRCLKYKIFMKHYSLIFLFFCYALVSNGQCIDSTLINPDCTCIQLYDPVCGCDEQMYFNPCDAECNGVTSYTSAYDSTGNLMDCAFVQGANLCDSIEVSLTTIEYDFDTEEAYFEMALNTFFYGDDIFVYAGFVLLDENGDTVAYEDEQAANVYGFGAQTSEVRVLIIDEYIELPFEGTLELIEGYFSGNEQTACSFPVTFDISGVSLDGQYFIESEFDYVEFTSDSMMIFDFEDDMECFYYIGFNYSANDSVVALFNDEFEEIQMLSYQYDSTLIFTVDGDDMELVPTAFSTEEWEECSGDSTCKIMNVFAEPQPCDTMGNFMVTLSFEVENALSSGFNVKINGADYGSFTYDESSYVIGPLVGDGQTNYEFVVSDIDDMTCFGMFQLGTISCDSVSSLVPYSLIQSRTLFEIRNMLGERILSPQPNVPYLYLFEDGTIEKKVFFKQ